jgi:hypothetical protein
MARAHTAGKEKHGNMARIGLLRLLFFSSFCSVIPEPDPKKMNSSMSKFSSHISFMGFLYQRH